jgi:hypothetical protein
MPLRIFTEAGFDLHQARMPIEGCKVLSTDDRFVPEFTAIPMGQVMNYSIATADRTTHLRVVVVGLLWAIMTAGVVIALA